MIPNFLISNTTGVINLIKKEEMVREQINESLMKSDETPHPRVNLTDVLWASVISLPFKCRVMKNHTLPLSTAPETYSNIGGNVNRKSLTYRECIIPSTYNQPSPDGCQFYVCTNEHC